MKGTLGLSLPLLAAETLHGYASRLARAYGTDLVSFCADLGLALMGLVSGAARDVAALAALTGEPEAELVRRAPVGTHEFRTLAGQRLNRNELRCGRLLVCPACLREDVSRAGLASDLGAFVRMEWLVRTIRTCHVHDIALQPVDEPPPKWPASRYHDRASRVAGCLDNLDALALRAEVRKASGLERHLVGRLRGDGAPSPLLDAVPFDIAVTICEHVGALALHGSSCSIREIGPEGLGTAAAAGFDVLSGGEPDLRSFLKEIHRTFVRGFSSNEGAAAIYDPVYVLIKKSRLADDYEPIRTILRQHILATMPIAAGTNLLGEVVPVRLLHSLRTAAEEIGKPGLKLRKLLAGAGLLPDGHESMSAGRVIFDAQALSALKSTLQHGLNSAQAAKRLNLPRAALRSLSWGGLIEHTVLQNGASGSRFFDEATIDRFLDRLTAEAQQVAECGPGIQNVMGAARTLGRSVVVVLRLIMDGELSWVGRQAGVEGGLKPGHSRATSSRIRPIGFSFVFSFRGLK